MERMCHRVDVSTKREKLGWCSGCRVRNGGRTQLPSIKWAWPRAVGEAGGGLGHVALELLVTHPGSKWEGH